MYRVLLVVWIALPVAVIAWHLGPGRLQLAADQAGTHIRAAEAAQAKGNWLDMAEAYARAAEALPPEATTARRRLLLAAAVGRIKSGQRPAGQRELQQLRDAMQSDPTADAQLLAAVRHEIATADYQSAWIMRLNGADDDAWKPLVARAQQQFRQLAEEADRSAVQFQNPQSTNAQRNAYACKTNLEAAIYLEHMDLARLKAIRLPDHLQPLVKTSGEPDGTPASDAEPAK